MQVFFSAPNERGRGDLADTRDILTGSLTGSGLQGVFSTPGGLRLACAIPCRIDASADSGRKKMSLGRVLASSDEQSSK
jgi:hypothetical protein